MRAILPRHRLATEDAEIYFVQNGGCLQGVARALATHFTGRNPMQLAIDQFHKSIRSLDVTQAPAVQQAGDIMRLAIFRNVHQTRL